MRKVKYEAFKNMAQLRELLANHRKVVQKSSVMSTGKGLVGKL